MVSEELSAFARGRIPAHEFRETMMVSFLLLQAKARLSNHQFLMSEYDLKTGLNGMPWKMSRPGRGQAVIQICEATGCGDVNLMQRACYNGHYKYHGRKVQHVVQADGMAHSFTYPIKSHDALVLRNFSMIIMLSSVFIGGDLNWPVITVTGKAYGSTNHFKPLHTDAELRMMVREERVAAMECQQESQEAMYGSRILV